MEVKVTLCPTHLAPYSHINTKDQTPLCGECLLEMKDRPQIASIFKECQQRKDRWRHARDQIISKHAFDGPNKSIQFM